jgi:hypothetical protein
MINLTANLGETMRDAAMLLLLRRPFTDCVTFCAFKKFREVTPVEERSRERRSVRERKVLG